jgi:DNA-binding NtrC family response regulator
MNCFLIELANFIILNLDISCKKINDVVNRQYIAIIDDEIDHVRLFSAALELSGFKSVGFNNALHATEYLSSHHLKFSMVIVDLRMSDMSGDKLIKLISEMDYKIKIIVVSASSKDRQSNDIQKYEYLQKPVRIEKLLEIVKKHFLG